MNTLITAGSMVAVVVMIPLQLLASPIRGPAPWTFSVPGAATVINTGSATLTGDPGVAPGSAFTGKATIIVNGSNAAVVGDPSLPEADAVATLAQAPLALARTSFGPSGPGTPATVGCGSPPATVEAVSRDRHTPSIDCADTAFAGSRGLSGGLDIPPGEVVPVPSSFVRVPQPAVLLLFAAGLLALFCLDTRHDGRRRQPPSDGASDFEHDEPQATASTG